MASESPAALIEREGWAATGPVLSGEVIDEIIRQLRAVEPGRGGVRNLLSLSAVRELACSRPVRSFAELILGPGCFAVRGIIFDKTPDSNWKVIWHQDLTIAVEQRVETDGFGPWTNKGGIPHVHAPVALLERMVSIRVHLDACGPDNGPMRVLPGSHREGRLSADAIARWRGSRTAAGPAVERGGLLAFRPLLLHASSAAVVPSHRRVIHLEFAAEQLPEPLRWQNSTRPSP
jgi:ectoine hydroxylase-related dioxygenase (phytanoyl-CoA dioxygenase family)